YGVAIFYLELAPFLRVGGYFGYIASLNQLVIENDRVAGVMVGDETIAADSVILACGGFEADGAMRAELMGEQWTVAKVRGTPNNTGDGLRMAWEAGAARYGSYEGCHATPMDLQMKDFGNLDIPHAERKNYRKICYFLGVMLNADGERFVDEGINFRNYTYAQFGKAVLEQPGHFAWQIFDAKVFDLLYEEYHFHDAHYIEADTLPELIGKLDGVDQNGAATTLNAFNDAVDDATAFDPTSLDGKGTQGLPLAKSNWAQRIDTAPFRAYPVTGGITFTYGGVKVDETGRVLREDDTHIADLHACGEMVGGVFFGGYPGGSGLTSGAVFGRRAGHRAAVA
ncbi:MAG: FAD-dependent tricarballylate dehydrogenase TcuA, partial [Pseudomonadota bacterium]